MTWNELFEELCKQCSCEQNASNMIGHLMDDYESWDWDAVAPAGAVGILRDC